MSWFQHFKRRAKELEGQTFALYLACRHPGTPWYAKAVAACVVAYALSPIDLIPDFIPVLGYLDDLILIPLGIAMVIRLVPGPIMEECRRDSQRRIDECGPRGWVGAAVVIVIWVSLAALCGWLAWRWFRPARGGGV